MLVHKESEIISLYCKYSNCIIAFRTLQVYLGHKCGLVQHTVSSWCYLTRSRETQYAYCQSIYSRMSAVLIYHELQRTVVTIHTSGSNIQEFLPICTEGMFLRINICCFPMQLLLNDLCNGDPVFSLMQELFLKYYLNYLCGRDDTPIICVCCALRCNQGCTIIIKKIGTTPIFQAPEGCVLH